MERPSDESPKAGPSNNILNPLDLIGKIKKCPKNGCTFIAKKKPCLVKHFNSHKVNYSSMSACCTKTISPNFLNILVLNIVRYSYKKPI